MFILLLCTSTCFSYFCYFCWLALNRRQGCSPFKYSCQAIADSRGTKSILLSINITFFYYPNTSASRSLQRQFWGSRASSTSSRMSASLTSFFNSFLNFYWFWERLFCCLQEMKVSCYSCWDCSYLFMSSSVFNRVVFTYSLFFKNSSLFLFFYSVLLFLSS